MSEKALFMAKLEDDLCRIFRASSIEEVAAYIIKQEIPIDDIKPMADLTADPSLAPNRFEYTRAYETSEGCYEIWVRKGQYKEMAWIDLNITNPHTTFMYTMSEIAVEEID